MAAGLGSLCGVDRNLVRAKRALECGGTTPLYTRYFMLESGRMPGFISKDDDRLLSQSKDPREVQR